MTAAQGGREGMTEKTIREHEVEESAPHIAEARKTGKPVTFIASDGCEVTCLPDGNVLFNASDWW
jgi:hypothetical protein